MITVGITGQAGFVGTHLYNTLGLYPQEFTRIPFDDAYFDNPALLEAFAKDCDAIVHLAAMNRHNDPQVIYDTNIRLVKQLIEAMEQTGSKPHVLFSSSTQEERDNPYGQSKKEGREMLASWAQKNEAAFTGLIIPNVFGPFGNPFYNSVIATFCHQLTHGEQPEIDIDGELKLIYVGELVGAILEEIRRHKTGAGNLTSTIDHGKSKIENIHVSFTSTISVSELLAKLTGFRDQYFEKGIIPDLKNSFDRYLFNTFLCFIDHESFFPFMLKKNMDNRGSFVETIKLNSGGQVSFSTTKPGITRGNHFHTRKAERFAVIKGKARIQLRRIGTDKVLDFYLDGENPSFVDMPVWHTHNITNIGEMDLYTIFWINEFYEISDPDTFFEIV
ncbi:MAG: NAD-dependent epimerase/dehydratase family protein [Bacteroidales bacterium]|nr:NAD-dependent epimerase/dehydratase family protein [Bacteroidales bacterium]